MESATQHIKSLIYNKDEDLENDDILPPLSISKKTMEWFNKKYARLHKMNKTLEKCGNIFNRTKSKRIRDKQIKREDKILDEFDKRGI